MFYIQLHWMIWMNEDCFNWTVIEIWWEWWWGCGGLLVYLYCQGWGAGCLCRYRRTITISCCLRSPIFSKNFYTLRAVASNLIPFLPPCSHTIAHVALLHDNQHLFLLPSAKHIFPTFYTLFFAYLFYYSQSCTNSAVYFFLQWFLSSCGIVSS